MYLEHLSAANRVHGRHRLEPHAVHTYSPRPSLGPSTYLRPRDSPNGVLDLAPAGKDENVLLTNIEGTIDDSP